MYPLRMAAISGYTGTRTPMFSNGAGDMFGLGSPRLGRTDQEWYSEAVEEVAEYDDLLTRARKIAYKPSRDQILANYYGDPTDRDSASYRRNSVAQYIQSAQGYVPINYLVFSEESTRDRVQKLKDWNSRFKDVVETAEATYGSLAAPERIETVVSQTPGWVPVVVVGALAVAGLAALGVFRK